MPEGAYCNAKQAAARLGVTLPTLYAYASRGQLRSEPVPGRPRERRYHREDIDRLLHRKEARGDPAKAAERGLHWGGPVLSSGLTLIHNGRLYYRGRDVIELAKSATLEHTAALLWDSDPPETFPVPPARIASVSADPIVRLQSALPVAGAKDLAAYDLRPPAVRQAGARILRLFTALVAGRATSDPAHLALQKAWAPRDAGAAEAIRIALVLCADHELNVSAFTARCAASAGATPYDTVCAALATLKGARHGGETRRVRALLEEIASSRRARAVLSGRLRRGERLPGFGHPLYPEGDPRAALLMSLSRDPLAHAVSRAGHALFREHVNLDFGLVALARARRLPESAPLVLFALGRTVGWIAHAIEQYASPELIRPRANYTGPPPAIP
jgi:citrate synthase